MCREWGVEKITFVALLASKQGLARAAGEWPEGTEFFVGAVDDVVNAKGYIEPGIGDIGDRLFGTNLA
jgi:uracil phosphoribosyltransferase